MNEILARERFFGGRDISRHGIFLLEPYYRGDIAGESE